MSSKYLILPFATLIAACSGAASSDSASSNQDLSGSAITPGYYVLDKEEAPADRWIQQLNLHTDGSFDAVFGNDVSNLSGHQYVAQGTYAIDSKASTISFSELGVSDAYAFKFQDGELLLKFIGEASSPQPWFSVAKQPSPVTITFNADFTQSQSGPLKAGATALVRYATARAQCLGDDQGYFLDYVIDGGTVGNEFFGEQFSGLGVKGFVDLLITIPQGHDLAFYFTNTAAACNGVDSSFGKNYHFAIE